MGSPGSLEDHKPILVLFDGVCNLCSGLVKFIITRDPAGKFRFASLQSGFGRSQLLRFNLNPEILHSVIVIDHDVVFQRSDAALYIAKHIGLPWNLLTGFKILPKFLRDAGYNTIAKSRYRLFGKKESCMIPTAELRERFVD